MHIELRGIHKSFGEVHANAGISLAVPPSFIQGILGENGAGKSTLMKILSGFLILDAGQILLDGTPVAIHSPADAIHHGIGMLHQDPLDFPPIKVLDSFILGREGGLLPERHRAAREMKALCEQFGFAIDPDAYIDTLTVGERQQLEIMRLLWMGAKVLILDEPTTGISQPQKVKLFATLQKLAAQGMTILFVSHKLEDVEFLVLPGRRAAPGRARRRIAASLRHARPGAHDVRQGGDLGGRTTTAPGDPVISLYRVSLEGARLQVNDITLSARAGEVIGLAGMEGSGQSLLLSALRRPSSAGGGPYRPGGTRRHGKPVSRLQAPGRGISARGPSGKRARFGLSIAEHFVLSERGKGMMIDRRAAASLAAERIGTYNIKDLRPLAWSTSRGKPAAHAPGAPAGVPLPDPSGAAHAGAGHRVDALHLAEAQGALPQGAGDRLRLR